MDPLKQLRESIAAEIPPEELAILDSGNSHDYRCRCETCRQWWKLMGPDGGEEGNYGPFTEDEIKR